MRIRNRLLLAMAVWRLLQGAAFADAVDLTKAVIVTRSGNLPPAEKTAAVMLAEELQKRTGIRLEMTTTWPQDRPVIALTSQANAGWSRPVPALKTALKAEGYRLLAQNEASRQATVWVIGADARGVLYGSGALLRHADWSKGKLSVDSSLDITTSPAYAIRGHQIGYRTHANTYDAWSPSQYEQYIRDLAIFGANSIENIPFQDPRVTQVMKFARPVMNRRISEICQRYGMDYWVWVPAEYDLKDAKLRAAALTEYEEFFRNTPHLTALFFPGGDPGQNPPELVLPFLEDVAARMKPGHPNAKIWLSLQWFTPAQIDTVYKYIDEKKPDWFEGLVAGPSGPPIPATRLRLPKQYKLRIYPDLTHNKISQYQVPNWDQAFALTLGREAINPRPAEYTKIHNYYAPYSDGFLSYSDGAHDDVNKAVWSALSWDPQQGPRDIMVEYARAYFSPAVAEEAADAILGLERNWRGPLKNNGAVEGTLLQWQNLEKKAPELETNWRWQMCLLRANYDAYIRRRLIREIQIEDQANAIMSASQTLGSERAMKEAEAALKLATDQPTAPDLRARIEDLCAKLFDSIGLQTSVPKYFASGAERGAVLDMVDYPMNNRWWLEDEFKKIRAMNTEADRVRRLQVLAAWENPGPGSYYDNVGNESKSPHVVRADAEIYDPGSERRPEPTFWWWDQGQSRARLTWQATMWPRAVVYEGLDPEGHYVVRSSGYGQALLRVNGDRIQPTIDAKEMGELKEFPIPAKYLKDRKLTLTWDIPTDEAKLNWRQHSRLAEVWLVKQ